MTVADLSATGWEVNVTSVGGAGVGPALTSWLSEWDATNLLNDVGTGRGLLLASPACCAALAGIEPWWSELRVSAPSSQVVFEGPILYAPAVFDDAGTAQIIAGNMLQWLKVRRVRYSHNVTNVDACVWVADLIADGLSLADPGLLDHLTVVSGGPLLTRSINVSTDAPTTVWDAISDLLGVAVDIACHGRRITVMPTSSCAVGDIGVLGSTMFAGRWALDRDGAKFSTARIVSGTGVSATAGGVLTSGSLSLLVERIVTDSSVTTVADATHIAAAGVNYTTTPITLVIDGDAGAIDCGSGIDPCRVQPGACCTVQVDACGTAVQQALKVRGARYASDGTGGVTLGLSLGVVDTSADAT